MANMRLILELAPFRLEIDDLGSIKEASELLANEDTELARQFDERFLSGNAISTENGIAENPAAPGATAPTAETPARRGRKPKNQPDPATAQAPAPIPAPALAQQVADATGSDGLKIPPFLDRSATAPAAPPAAPAAPTMAAPPPPVLPVAPPVVPAAPTPPVSVLAPKLIEELNRRAVDDGSKRALSEWLAKCGIIMPNMTYEEAIASLPFVDDVKLQPVAANLGIA